MSNISLLKKCSIFIDFKLLFSIMKNHRAAITELLSGYIDVIISAISRGMLLLEHFRLKVIALLISDSLKLGSNFLSVVMMC